MLKETTIDKFGRVLIPQEIRDRFGLEPGTTLEICEGSHEIRLVPVRDESSLVMKGHVLVHRGKAVGDMVDAVRRDRESRMKKLSPKSGK